MDIIVIMDTIIQNLQNKINILSKLFVFALLLLFVTGCGKDIVSQSSDFSSDLESSVISTENSGALHRMEVVLDGKKYIYNDHLTNIVIMGVDNESIPETSVGSPSSGQADTIYLVSFDRVTGKLNVISIPRDTITEVDVFDRDDEPLGPSTLQITLAYAFGDGKHGSCLNVKEAVSRLFYRLPIQNYCSLTLESMEKICELFGTISVTIPNDSLVKVYPNMSKGAVVDLTAQNVEAYLRYRDTTVSHSALLRSERHHAFLKACEEQILQDFYNDPEKIADVYEDFSPYMITNMNVGQIAEIFEKLDTDTPIHSWTVPGKAVTTDKYDEFHIDEDALYNQIIMCFFEEVTSE